MKIILTGASGFLGKVMHEEWLKNNHEVITVGRTITNNIICDLSEHVETVPISDMVVHAASKAHVIPKSEIEKQLFFDVNVTGTANLLAALEKNNAIPNTFVYISSVSVYGADHGTEIDESYKLEAVDPYGKSKIEAENIIAEWCTKHHIKWYIFRLPLIAGPHPKGNLGDMINLIKKGFYFSVGKGTAKKSIVGAREVARFIVSVSGKSGIYNLTFNPHPELRQIEIILSDIYGKKVRSIPQSLAFIIAKFGDFGSFIPLNSRRLGKITTTLTFSDTKARKTIGWPPCSLTLQQLFD